MHTYTYTRVDKQIHTRKHKYAHIFGYPQQSEASFYIQSTEYRYESIWNINELTRARSYRHSVFLLLFTAVIDGLKCGIRRLLSGICYTLTIYFHSH